MDHPQHKEVYKVNAYAVDSNKNLSIPDLVKLMHETAMQHVLILKLSVWDLEPLNLAWVLTRIKVVVKRLPKLSEEIYILTNPSGFERIRTSRDYRVYDQNDELIAYAFTEWFLMDTNTRRIAKVPEHIKMPIVEAVAAIPEHLERDRATKFPAFDNVQYNRQFKVGHFDLDFNEHLNNVFYAKWILEALPSEILKQKKLKSLELIYRMECVLDEEVTSEVQALEEDQFIHRLVKNGKEVTLAKTIWEHFPKE